MDPTGVADIPVHPGTVKVTVTTHSPGRIALPGPLKYISRYNDRTNEKL